MGLITTSEVAERLGVHRSRVQVLIQEGRLPAQRYGKVYLVEESALKLVEDRKPGRPSKLEKEKAAKKSQARKQARAKASRNGYTKEKRA
ncbi:MAG: helix-turn-helix domain-containing protein [Acidobacteriota bacterium]